MGTGICQACHGAVNDGLGVGFVNRHLNSEEHVEAIKRNQAKAKELMEQRDANGFVPWTAIDVDTVENLENEERMELRRALERALKEEVE